MYVGDTGVSFADSDDSVPVNDDDVALELKGLIGSSGQHLYEEYCEIRSKLHHKGGIYNCKNNHFYSRYELQLMPSIFEGVTAYVPIGWAGILEREYPNWRQTRYKQWEFIEGEWKRVQI